MKGTVRVVCGPAPAAGFALAGLVAVEVDGPTRAAEAVLTLAGDPEVGLVLVQDDLAPDLRALERRVGKAIPALVPFPAPGPGAEGAAAAYVAEILRRAVGYRVRL